MTQSIVDLQNIGRRYGKLWAVRSLDLTVPEGSCFGILGRNGAGKTTTMRMMAGLMPPHEGQLRIAGLDPWVDRIPSRLTTGFTGDDIGLYPRWTVSRTIGFASRMFPDWNPEESARLLRQFELPGDRRVSQLSKGNLARLKLLLVLARQPRVLLIDEPFGGLDVVIRREVIDGLIDYMPTEGRTVVLTSHLIHELERLVDHLAIISGGKTAFCGTLDELKSSVRRVSLIAEADLDPFAGLPWVRRAKRWGRGWQVTVTDFDERRLEQLKGEGYSIEAVESLSLEDIAFEFLSDIDGDKRESGEEAA